MVSKSESKREQNQASAGKKRWEQAEARKSKQRQARASKSKQAQERPSNHKPKQATIQASKGMQAKQAKEESKTRISHRIQMGWRQDRNISRGHGPSTNKKRCRLLFDFCLVFGPVAAGAGAPGFAGAPVLPLPASSLRALKVGIDHFCSF